MARRSDSEYFDLLEQAAANALRTSELLCEMVVDYPEHQELGREILLCEQTGDRITHAIIQRLAGPTRPPFEGSAMHRLATTIDDVVDHTEQVSDMFGLYAIEAPMDQAGRLAIVLRDSCEVMSRTVAALRGGEPMNELIVEAHRLENEGDRVSRDAVASLFAGGVDPMVVIRWKDIFEQFEQAIDACETVAHELESASLA
jgi:uncharacterized protein Yka (UPF0111/DUF47 family)